MTSAASYGDQPYEWIVECQGKYLAVCIASTFRKKQEVYYKQNRCVEYQLAASVSEQIFGTRLCDHRSNLLYLKSRLSEHPSPAFRKLAPRVYTRLIEF